MDRVRFGRALGYGARHAAKTLAKAAEAATAATPQREPPRQSTPLPPATLDTRPEVLVPHRPAARTIGSPRPAPPKDMPPVAVPRKQAPRRGFWSPLAQFSRVLWLEVTGTFFALLAVFLSQGLWKDRAALRLSPHSAEAGKLYLHALAFAVFTYFAVSSFVRAYRKP